jgi:hypothetical protein
MLICSDCERKQDREDAKYCELCSGTNFRIEAATFYFARVEEEQKVADHWCNLVVAI